MNPFANEPENVLLPLPTQGEVDSLVQSLGVEQAMTRIRGLLQSRRQTIAAAAADPIRCAPRPKFWRIAQRLIRNPEVKLLALLGGNRSSKSYCAAYWLLDAALSISTAECATNEGVTFMVASESEESSKATAQKIIWSLLPDKLKALNNRRSSVTYIRYSIKEGFGGDKTLVLPSGVQIKFATYNQDPDEWEGRELGLKHRRSFAWWADENMPLNWLMMLQRRGRFRPGFGVWSFTPIRGITPAIKHAVGSGRVRHTRAASLLPSNQVLAPGLPPGRVPFVQDGCDESVKVCYYHSDLTPFGSGGQTYGELVRQQVEGKTRDYILAVYYGFTRDVAGRAWPKYAREIHMVEPEELPWEGTNYVFVDPAGGRSWFFIWVRVAPGNPRRLYLYRDWPDKRRHGEWAVPSTRQMTDDGRRGRDGEAGPAQRNQGGGIPRYKRRMLEEETIDLRLTGAGVLTERDPHRRHTANRAIQDAGLEPIREWVGASGMPECAWTPEQIDTFRALNPEPVREVIRIRFIDPRAAGQPQQTKRGERTLINVFAEENRREDGSLEAPTMHLRPAFSGGDRDDGIRAVNDLLDYDEEQEVVAFVNEPRLRLTSNCEQLDWVLTHYTGMGSETDGGKDPADLLRYIAMTEDVRHVGGEGKLVTGGFKEGWE
jgi:hypothetical protein